MQDIIQDIQPQADEGSSTSVQLEAMQDILRKEIPEIIVNVERSYLAADKISRTLDLMNEDMKKSSAARDDLAETLQKIHEQNKEINSEIIKLRRDVSEKVAGADNFHTRVYSLGENGTNATKLNTLNDKNSGTYTNIRLTYTTYLYLR